jgi:ABC-type microcin C transport system permease subunit YejE
LSMLAIPSQAISVSIGTLTGSTGMLTDMTGNRAIHAAIGILQ